jgi:hypothetical protein
MKRIIQGAIWGLAIGGLYGIACLGPFLLNSSPIPVTNALALGSGVQALSFSLLFAYGEYDRMEQKEYGVIFDVSLSRYNADKVLEELSSNSIEIRKE